MHVEGIEEPLVASRSEVAIARDVAVALGQQTPGAAATAGGSPVRSRSSEAYAPIPCSLSGLRIRSIVVIRPLTIVIPTAPV